MSVAMKSTPNSKVQCPSANQTNYHSPSAELSGLCVDFSPTVTLHNFATSELNATKAAIYSPLYNLQSVSACNLAREAQVREFVSGFDPVTLLDRSEHEMLLKRP